MEDWHVRSDAMSASANPVSAITALCGRLSRRVGTRSSDVQARNTFDVSQFSGLAIDCAVNIDRDTAAFTTHTRVPETHCDTAANNLRSLPTRSAAAARCLTDLAASLHCLKYSHCPF